MLEELSIRNYALIDSISLSFRSGFNVLSGETGAGKSIIVGSLSFLMGGKAEADVIRSGSEEASVCAVVSINKENTEVMEWLRNRDINCDEDTIIIRRTIKTSGRSSAFIQETPVTKADLGGFMSLLFDLHGQHDHESLLRKENHRRYLDRFAGIEGEVLAYSRYFIELTEKRKALEASFSSQKDRETKMELLRYAVDEITAAAPRCGEMVELENESQLLSGFEKLAYHVSSAADSLFDSDESSVLSLARRTRNALDSAVSIDSSLAGLQKRLEDMFYEAQDIAGEFRSYRDNLQFDPKRQEFIDERLGLLYKLGKKYGQTEEAMLAYKTEALTEIETLTNTEENREKLKTEITALEKETAARAAAVRQKRMTAAASLGQKTSAILTRLGMPSARFSPSIIAKTRDDGSQAFVCGPWGAEDVEFLISAN